MTTLYLIGGGALLVLAIVLLWNRSARTLGRTEAKAEGAVKAVEAARKGQVINEDVRRLSDADLYDELRNPPRRK